MKSWWKPHRETRYAVVMPVTGGLLGLALQIRPDPASPRCQLIGHAHLDNASLGTDALLQLADQIGARKARWVMLLDHADYQTLSLPAPPVPAAELDPALRWTLAEQLPAPATDACLAWLRVPRHEHMPGKTEQMYVFASRRQTVEGIARLFRQAGLDLSAVDVQETAQRNVASLIATPTEAVALLRINRLDMEFTLSHEGELHYHRWVPNVPQKQVDELQSAEHLVLQVQRSLDYVDRNLHYLPIRQLWLALASPLAGLRELLIGNLTLPVAGLDLNAHFDFAAGPELRDPALQATFLPLLGACLRFSEPGWH